MSGCTATLTTATVTDEVVAHYDCLTEHDPAYCNASEITDGSTVQRQGDRLVRVEVHTLTCGLDSGSHIRPHRVARNTLAVREEWTDDTPGATPHADPLVTDAEVDAAWLAFTNGEGGNARPVHMGRNTVRALLEAAARIRQGDAT